MGNARVTIEIILEGEPVELYPGLVYELRARAANEAIIERAEYAARTLTPPADGWDRRAACADLPSELMFPSPGRGSADDAVEMCRTLCPVALSCLRAAARDERTLHASYIFGVRGGLTAQHRGTAYKMARARKAVA